MRMRTRNICNGKYGGVEEREREENKREQVHYTADEGTVHEKQTRDKHDQEPIVVSCVMLLIEMTQILASSSW
jgi:hypothetical protein